MVFELHHGSSSTISVAYVHTEAWIRAKREYARATDANQAEIPLQDRDVSNGKQVAQKRSQANDVAIPTSSRDTENLLQHPEGVVANETLLPTASTTNLDTGQDPQADLKARPHATLPGTTSLMHSYTLRSHDQDFYESKWFIGTGIFIALLV